MQVSSVLSQSEALKKLPSTLSAPQTGDFNTLLSGILSPDPANNVNEEELFAGIVEERVNNLKGPELQKKFSDLLAKEENSMQKADGFIPCEDAAKSALKKLRDSGDLTSDEADKIYSESFSAAQLDGNKNALFDGKGGAGDATVALQKLEQALLSARTKLEGFDSGAEEAEKRSVGEASNSKTSVAAAAVSAPQSSFTASTPSSTSLVTPNGLVVDGANNFLFKPISENEGTLAVLMPSDLAHNVMSLVLKDEGGNVIEEGHSTGFGDTGEREKFSFSKPGGSYGNNLTVEARLNDGSSRQYLIPDPSKRYD
jgi:hypothetical protein